MLQGENLVDKIDLFFCSTTQVGEGTMGPQTIQRKVVASHQQFRHRHKALDMKLKLGL